MFRKLLNSFNYFYCWPRWRSFTRFIKRWTTICKVLFVTKNRVLYFGDFKVKNSNVRFIVVSMLLFFLSLASAKAQNLCAELFYQESNTYKMPAPKLKVSVSDAVVHEIIEITRSMPWPLRSELLSNFFKLHLEKISTDQAITMAKAIGRNNINDRLLWTYIQFYAQSLSVHDAIKIVAATSSYDYRNPMLQNYMQLNLSNLNVHEAMQIAKAAGDNRYINEMLWQYFHFRILSLTVEEAIKLAAGTRDNQYYNDMIGRDELTNLSPSGARFDIPWVP